MNALQSLHKCIGCDTCLAKQNKKLTKLSNVILPPVTPISPIPLCDFCNKEPTINMKCDQCNKSLCRSCIMHGNHCANGCEIFYCINCQLRYCDSCHLEFCKFCFYDTDHKDGHCDTHCIRCSNINKHGFCNICYELAEAEDTSEDTSEDKPNDIPNDMSNDIPNDNSKDI
jgi:hypothetical protein